MGNLKPVYKLGVILIFTVFGFLALAEDNTKYACDLYRDSCYDKKFGYHGDGYCSALFDACFHPNFGAGTTSPTPPTQPPKKSSPDEIPPDGASSSGAFCMSRMRELETACNSQVIGAQNSCDDQKDSGMMRAQKTIATMGQQVTNGIFGACTTMGKVTTAANGALAAYKLNCSNAIETCSSSCATAMEFYKTNSTCIDAGNGISNSGVSAFGNSSGGSSSGGSSATYQNIMRSKSSCTSLSSNIVLAQQAIQNVMVGFGQAANCADMTNGLGNVPEICKTNPNLPSCSGVAMVDCNSPAMAKEKVCVCRNTPNDPSCINITSGPDGSASSGGNSNSQKITPTSLPGDGFFDGLSGLPEIKPGEKKSGAEDSAVDGKKGQGALLGDGGGGAGHGGGATNGKNGNDGAGGNNGTEVTAGFYSGGGAGSGFGANGYGGSSFNADQLQSDPSPESNDFNLRQFLPGHSLDPHSRGVAGAIGVDGVTGPNSNIWLKIQNRYNVLSPSLMP